MFENGGWNAGRICCFYVHLFATLCPAAVVCAARAVVAQTTVQVQYAESDIRPIFYSGCFFSILN